MLCSLYQFFLLDNIIFLTSTSGFHLNLNDIKLFRRGHYFTFPWLATASMAFFTDSSSPR
jgi:hypothetical protein